METLELVDAPRCDRARVGLAAVVVNRVLPELFTRDDEERVRRPAHRRRRVERCRRCRRRRRCAAVDDVTQVLDAAALAVALRRERAENLALLQERLRPGPRHRAGARALRPQPWQAGGDAGRRGARRGAELMAPPTPTLEQLLSAKEVVVTCGAGGVGKTTTAAALATMAALHLGGRVLVLTIDPARRLADALGLEGIGNEERRVGPRASSPPPG